MSLGFVICMPVFASGAASHRQVMKTKLEITDPYAHKGLFLFKGNTHAHTTNSTDGRNTPAEVMTFFRNRGYDFNALTDHEYVTADPDVRGILFLKGTEDGLGATGRDHMIKIGPKATATLLTDNQVSVDTALAEGDYVGINHPDGVSDWPLSSILDTHGQYSMAIWNGVRRLEFSSQVDAALNAGKRLNLIAEEDLHDTAIATSGLQGIRVFADRLNEHDITDSLKKGNYYSFYTPAGAKDLTIRVKHEGRKITVVADKSSTFVWYGKGMEIQTDTDTRSATYELVGDEKYIRCRITRADGAVAWTNPIYIDWK